MNSISEKADDLIDYDPWMSLSETALNTGTVFYVTISAVINKKLLIFNMCI